MIPSLSLFQLTERGVVLQSHEAVALAQRLIETCGVDLTPPLGPPTLESVWLGADGSVTCRGCAVTPAVSEIGLLLESMLPRGRTRAPGGLRYTIARSLLEVDAPPFDSLRELSATLTRYERGDRTTVLRELYTRLGASNERGTIAPFVERRRTSPSADNLRRRLREADREAFERRALADRRRSAEPMVVVPIVVPSLEMASPRDVHEAAGTGEEPRLLPATAETSPVAADPVVEEQPTLTATAASAAASVVDERPALAPATADSAAASIVDDAPVAVPVGAALSAADVELHPVADAPLLFERRSGDSDYAVTASRRRARGGPLPWLAATAAAAALSFAAGHAIVTWRQAAPLTSRTAAPAAGGTARASAPSARRGADRSATAPSRGGANVPLSTTSDTPTRSGAGAGATGAQPIAARTADPAPSVTLARALDRETGPAFSPAFASNGTLFFHTGRSADARSDLASADLTGDLRVMTIAEDGARNYHVQPSPDDKRVAFDSDRDGERGVYVANRDGSNVRRVSGSGYAAVPTWSPDGSRLAFIRAEADRPHVWNLWLLALESGEMRRLTSFLYGQTWGASWFQDGRRIVYTHEDRLVVLDLESGVTRRFASPVARRLMRTPAVSPDGQRVIFQLERSGAWLLDLTDGSMRCVLTDPTAEEFAWSPDGRRVAFHSRRDGQWGIWLMGPS